MKNILNILVMTMLLLSSCARVDTAQPNGDDKHKKLVNNLISTTQYEVPIQEGHITNVLYKGALVASTSKQMTILLPKQISGRSRGTSVGDIQHYYQPGTMSQSISSLWQTIVFEDSPEGDFDYNDLVIHANYLVTDNNLKVSVQPIALGATKDIKLGFRWQQGSQQGDVVVAENCRTDLFDGNSGFLNSYSYDTHYNEFKKQVDVAIGDVSQAVNVWWYIIVDKNLQIFAVNDVGEECMDKLGMPYGFAISDCGVGMNAPKKLTASTVSYDDKKWNNTIVPRNTFNAWAHMPEIPTIPQGAKDMAGYEAWQGNKINRIPSGKTFSEQVQFVPGFELYVEGTLNLNSLYGNGPAKVYVMPGGKLNIGEDVTIQNIEIVNFGDMTFASKCVIQKSTILSSGHLEAPNTSLEIGAGAYFFVDGALVLDNLHINGNTSSYMYTKDMYITNMMDVTNKGEVFVEGSVNTARFNLSAGGRVYVDCKFTATSDAYLTNATTLSVKECIETPKLETTSDITININNGALINCTELLISNPNKTGLHVIGDDYGLIKANIISLTGLDISKTFVGNIYLVYDQLREGFDHIDLSNPRLRLPKESVKFNDSNASVGATTCSPGYGDNGSDGSQNSTWFPYPTEGTDISSCYNFSSWLEGKYDYTLKPGAKVFDVYNTQPKQGEQLSIYQMK